MLPTVLHTWRSTEPEVNTNSGKYLSVFRLIPAELPNLPEIWPRRPNIPAIVGAQELAPDVRFGSKADMTL